MIVNNSFNSLLLKKGRKGTISSINTSFSMNSLSALDAINKQLIPVKNDLEKSGFNSVSEVISLDNIQEKSEHLFEIASQVKSGNFIEQKSMKLSIECDEEEELVVIEFSPATGDILDWYQPSAKIFPTNHGATYFSSVEVSNLSHKKRVVFDIPLAQIYSSQAELYKQSFASLSFIKPFKKFIQVYVIKKIKDFGRRVSAEIWKPIAKKLDKSLVGKEVLGRFGQKGKPRKLSAAEKKSMAGNKVCLLVHGIISSTDKAFTGLREDGAFYQRLKNKYNGALIAYDHWTLGKSIEENAKDLAILLPNNIEIDIICHSRGAGVVRALLEKKSVQNKLKSKRIRVAKVCFVAGACEGSDLASENAIGRLFNTINKISILLGQPAISTALITQVIKLTIGGLQELPGTESMDPKGKYIQALRKSESTLADEYHYFRANFDSDNNVVSAIDEGLIDRIIFNGKGNDVIVPFSGAGVTDNYLKDKVIKKDVLSLGNESDTQPDVWHTTFFYNEDVKTGLKTSLCM